MILMLAAGLVAAAATPPVTSYAPAAAPASNSRFNGRLGGRTTTRVPTRLGGGSDRVVLPTPLDPRDRFDQHLDSLSRGQ